MKTEAGIDEGVHFTRVDATNKFATTRRVLFDPRVLGAVRAAIGTQARFLQVSDLHYLHDTGTWHRDSVHRALTRRPRRTGAAATHCSASSRRSCTWRATTPAWGSWPGRTSPRSRWTASSSSPLSARPASSSSIPAPSRIACSARPRRRSRWCGRPRPATSWSSTSGCSTPVVVSRTGRYATRRRRSSRSRSSSAPTTTIRRGCTPTSGTRAGSSTTRISRTSSGPSSQSAAPSSPRAGPTTTSSTPGPAARLPAAPGDDGTADRGVLPRRGLSERRQESPWLSTVSRILAMAKPQACPGLTLPGTETSSGLVTTSSSTGPGWASASRTAASSVVRVLDPNAVQPDRAGDGGEVGVVQHGAELGQPALLLLELDHAEPAVVEDDELDRQVVGDGGDQVAEQHRQAAVAAERDRPGGRGRAPARRAPAASRWPSSRG